MWISIITILLFFIYTALIMLYQSGWEKQKKFSPAPQSDTESLFFSIIIPARNEADNILPCLQSITDQHYPGSHYEVIVIDDFSTDNTAALVTGLQHPNIRVLQLKDIFSDEERIKAHKKKAIAMAIDVAQGDWIITTDADCLVQKNWLQCYSSFIQENKSSFVAGPVDYLPTKNKALSIFQSLDFLSLQGITAAAASHKAHVMCNGANLAYKKNIFHELGGFSGIDHIASGDDMLLMQKFYATYPNGVHYMLAKDAIVRTWPMDTWKNFINQRIRWASKADKYKDPKIFTVLLTVYLLNLSFLILGIWCIFDPAYVWLLICLLISKTLLELYFLLPVAQFFGKTKQLVWFPVAQPFHILYTIISGWLGKFGSYQWKGRKLSQREAVIK